jgi:hypothetical protein
MLSLIAPPNAKCKMQNAKVASGQFLHFEFCILNFRRAPQMKEIEAPHPPTSLAANPSRGG